MVMVYYGGKIRFHIPDFEAGDGWTSKVWSRLTFSTHIQDVFEQVVDLTHFLFVHCYKGIVQVVPPVVEECHFKTRIEINWRLNIPFDSNRYFLLVPNSNCGDKDIFSGNRDHPTWAYGQGICCCAYPTLPTCICNMQLP